MLLRFKLVVMILFLVLGLRGGNKTRCNFRLEMEGNAVVTFEGIDYGRDHDHEHEHDGSTI